ncbi:MAG: MFS transporter [Nocardioidaceae bacterium]|nr:MFS transporter [Nocardioidaceae bacterium]
MSDVDVRSVRAGGVPPERDERAGVRGWAGLVVLMLPVLMVSMDNTVLAFALPEISAELSPSGTALLWVVDIYALMLAGLLVAMGSLGDRVGRRRLLLVGAVGFGVVSVVAAYSPNVETLIASRAMLGVFGATLMPSTLSLLRNIFRDRTERRMAIATWAAGFSGGAALGPIIGGWVLGHFSWGAIFLINVPVVLVLVPLALWLLPESRDPNPGPVDPTSIALSLTTMLPATFAIKHLAGHGVDEQTIAAVAVAIASGWTFVRRQQARAARGKSPLIDVSLFADRVFTGALVSNLLSIMGLAGFLYFASQFLQLVVGMEPMEAALVLVPGLVATIAAGFLAVRMVRVLSIRVLVSGSFVLSASGYAIAAFVGDVPTAASLLVAFTVMGIGIGLAETLTNDVIIATVPASKSGAASAISETAYEIGAVLGTAVLGGLLTATYRAGVMIPSDVGPVDTVRAQETLGSAHQVAAGLGDEGAMRLLSSAHAAFDLGVQRTSAVAIGVALLAAFVAFRTLRGADVATTNHQ